MNKLKKFYENHKEAVITAAIIFPVAVIFAKATTKRGYDIKKVTLWRGEEPVAGDILDLYFKNGKAESFKMTESN